MAEVFATLEEFYFMDPWCVPNPLWEFQENSRIYNLGFIIFYPGWHFVTFSQLEHFSANVPQPFWILHSGFMKFHSRFTCVGYLRLESGKFNTFNKSQATHKHSSCSCKCLLLLSALWRFASTHSPCAYIPLTQSEYAGSHKMLEQVMNFRLRLEC